MTDPQERIILVTGCSSGIGHHCALRLHEEGWRVFATARKPEDIEALSEAGLAALYLDYADEASIDAALGEVLDKGGGRLDAVFNNGAYAQGGAVEDVTVDVLRAQFEANVFGWHALTRQVVPHMRRQGHGRIVHCSSILGVIPYRWRGSYVASKFAIEGLFHTQRLELQGSGVQMSLIQPGPILSKIGENGIRHFRENIDIEGSIHAATYRDYLDNLAKQGSVNLFRRPPEAVYRKLRHALNSSRPRATYPVTLPTHFMFGVKRFLPGRVVDWLVTRSG